MRWRGWGRRGEVWRRQPLQAVIQIISRSSCRHLGEISSRILWRTLRGNGLHLTCERHSKSNGEEIKGGRGGKQKAQLKASQESHSAHTHTHTSDPDINIVVFFLRQCILFAPHARAQTTRAVYFCWFVLVCVLTVKYKKKNPAGMAVCFFLHNLHNLVPKN